MKATRRRAMTWMTGLLVLLVSISYTVVTWAGPPVGVTATLIGRSTFGRFKVKTTAPESEEEHHHGIGLSLRGTGLNIKATPFPNCGTCAARIHVCPSPLYRPISEI